MNGIKPEHGIKPDPDHKSPGGFMDDDDIYEDTGELNMPAKDQESDIWLTRVPKWLWEAMANAADDEEIEIGKIAVFQDEETGRVSKDRGMQIFFNDKWAEKAKVPRAYELTPARETDPNTYVFTEKDLPGYKPMIYGRGRVDLPQAPKDPNAKPQKRSKYRKAIPSTTPFAEIL